MKTEKLLTTDERLEIMESNIREMNAMLRQLLAKSNDTGKAEKDRIMNVNEAASFLGIEKHVVYAKCAAGDIPCFRIGKLYKFKKSELVKWLNEQGIGGSVDPEEIANRYLQRHILKA